MDAVRKSARLRTHRAENIPSIVAHGIDISLCLDQRNHTSTALSPIRCSIQRLPDGFGDIDPSSGSQLRAQVPEFDDTANAYQHKRRHRSRGTHPSADPPEAMMFLSDFNANKLVTLLTALLYTSQSASLLYPTSEGLTAETFFPQFSPCAFRTVITGMIFPISQYPPAPCPCVPRTNRCSSIPPESAQKPVVRRSKMRMLPSRPAVRTVSSA